MKRKYSLRKFSFTLIMCSNTVIAMAHCNTADFSYTYDLCSPLTIKFYAENIFPDAFPGTSFIWDFGNGLKDDKSVDPTITYLISGIYTISLKLTGGLCLDEKSITIRVGLAEEETLLNIRDTTICFGESIFLQSTTKDVTCWKTSTGESGNSNYSWLVKPEKTTTYKITQL